MHKVRFVMKIAPVCEVPVCRGEWSLTVLLGYEGGAPEFPYPTIFTPASKTAARLPNLCPNF